MILTKRTWTIWLHVSLKQMVYEVIDRESAQLMIKCFSFRGCSWFAVETFRNFGFSLTIIIVSFSEKSSRSYFLCNKYHISHSRVILVISSAFDQSDVQTFRFGIDCGKGF